ncbi:MAG TPA: TspO/MBR family protein [Rhizomicrobium sp.]|jgi:tryptophan-rich sensory protein|nr:TspO/MBR family protein [Rhizomicrobium sp.]
MTFVDHVPGRHRGRYGALVLFLILTLAVGGAAGYATAPEIAGWYATLHRPSFAPPNGVFAPVWTTLYVLMGIAAWRVWRVVGLGSRPMLLFFVQLALNFAWSFLFFRYHRIDAALVEIVVLLLFIVWTAVSFARRDRIAGLLFVPYVAWVGFATALNAGFWSLNP